jgi:sugar-specific transcriptional regulator TrmB
MQNIKKLADSLQETGLSDKEILVYTALFDMGGGGYPSAIALQTKLNRSTTYKTLISLGIKGLVNEIEKKNKIFYQLNKPDRLIKYVEYRGDQISKKVSDIKQLLPGLSQLFQNLSNTPKVLFFEGSAEVAEIYKDMTSHSSYEMLALFNACEFENFLGDSALKEFIKKREKMKISMRAILPDTPRDLDYAERVYGSIKKDYFPITRHIPSKDFPFDGDITMYGKDRIAIIKLDKEAPTSQLIGVIIEDAVVHGMMKMFFELAWVGAKGNK